MSVFEVLEKFLDEKEKQPHPVHQYAFVSPKDITFSEHVRAACESNMCGRYGKSWTCPPGAGDWRDLAEHYRGYGNALVFTTKHDIEDSFDVEGMAAAAKEHAKVDEAVLKLLEKLDEPYELSGAGSCSVCTECTYPDAPCRFPKKARRSMEACGIDVVALSRHCQINYTNGTNTVTYFSIIYY